MERCRQGRTSGVVPALGEAMMLTNKHLVMPIQYLESLSMLLSGQELRAPAKISQRTLVFGIISSRTVMESCELFWRCRVRLYLTPCDNGRPPYRRLETLSGSLGMFHRCAGTKIPTGVRIHGQNGHGLRYNPMYSLSASVAKLANISFWNSSLSMVRHWCKGGSDIRHRSR